MRTDKPRRFTEDDYYVAFFATLGIYAALILCGAIVAAFGWVGAISLTAFAAIYLAVLWTAK